MALSAQWMESHFEIVQNFELRRVGDATKNHLFALQRYIAPLVP